MKTRMLVPALFATIIAISATVALWAVPASAAGLPSLEERVTAVSYTHLRAHETVLDLVCRPLHEKKKSM